MEYNNVEYKVSDVREEGREWARLTEQDKAAVVTICVCGAPHPWNRHGTLVRCATPSCNRCAPHRTPHLSTQELIRFCPYSRAVGLREQMWESQSRSAPSWHRVTSYRWADDTCLRKPHSQPVPTPDSADHIPNPPPAGRAPPQLGQGAQPVARRPAASEPGHLSAAIHLSGTTPARLPPPDGSPGATGR